MESEAAVCRACNGDGFVDAGLDRDVCPVCRVDTARMHELIAVFRAADGPLSEGEEELVAQIELLARSWDAVVRAIAPRPWQTPLQRAQELGDQFVILAQIRTLVKE